jgi:hypothetical protein
VAHMDQHGTGIIIPHPLNLLASYTSALLNSRKRTVNIHKWPHVSLVYM